MMPAAMEFALNRLATERRGDLMTPTSAQRIRSFDLMRRSR
jgi:hypothetical protein